MIYGGSLSPPHGLTFLHPTPGVWGSQGEPQEPCMVNRGEPFLRARFVPAWLDRITDVTGICWMWFFYFLPWVNHHWTNHFFSSVCWTFQRLLGWSDGGCFWEKIVVLLFLPLYSFGKWNPIFDFWHIFQMGKPPTIAIVIWWRFWSILLRSHRV